LDAYPRENIEPALAPRPNEFLQYRVVGRGGGEPGINLRKEHAMMVRTATMLSQLAGFVLLCLSSGGCSITETVKDILSSTTPGDWYTRDGLPKAEHKVDVFLATNLNNVKTDIARGGGEYLDSLGHLLEVKAADQDRFAAMVQDQYQLLADHDRTVVAGIVATAAQKIR